MGRRKKLPPKPVDDGLIRPAPWDPTIILTPDQMRAHCARVIARGPQRVGRHSDYWVDDPSYWWARRTRRNPLR